MFNDTYRQLTGKSVSKVSQKILLEKAPLYTAGLLDEEHTIVLSALMDSIESSFKEPVDSLETLDAVKPSHTKPASNTLKYAKQSLRNLYLDFQERLDEFQGVWKDRLQIETVAAHLVTNEWIVPTEQGTFKLRGTGTLPEAKQLYQQSVKDIVTEAIRIVALFEGAMARLEHKLAKEWHSESVQDNASKLLPLLEVSLRKKSLSELKEIRLSLAGHFSKHFTKQVCKWSKWEEHTEQALALRIMQFWEGKGQGDNGFMGYANFCRRFTLDYIQRLTYWYEQKWRLFLYGLEGESLQENT
jgi:hypothetical protein